MAERRAAVSALATVARRSKPFRTVFEEFSEKKTQEFSTEKYRRQWELIVNRHALPTLGPLPIQDIDLDRILSVLRPIWSTQTATATKLQQILDRTFAFAKVKGYRDGQNPAAWKGNLDVVLPTPSKVNPEQSYPAVRVTEVQRWWEVLKSVTGMGAEALRFQTMAVARSGAVRFATWDEFDLPAGLWTIQPGRAASKVPKGDTAKRIVLSDQAVGLLERLPRRSNCPYVFWAPRGGFLSDATIGKAMKAVHRLDRLRVGSGFFDAASGLPAVPHGIRSTFRTWVSDCTDLDGDMAEVALLHKVGTKVQQAYDRAEMIEKRRGLMTSWITFPEGPDAVAAREAEAAATWEAAVAQAARGLAGRRGHDPERGAREPSAV